LPPWLCLLCRPLHDMAPTLKALDLSHHNVGPNNGDIDFAAVAAFGILGVILKATQGVKMQDPTYADRIVAVRAAGMLGGAYDFNTGDPVKQQIDNFFDLTKPDDKLLCALDFEDNRVSQMTLTMAREYLELADAKLGRKFWIYSGNRIKELIPDADDETRTFFGTHKLWGCQYGPEFKMVDEHHQPLPWDKVTLWQFAGDGVNAQGIKIPGVDPRQAGSLDMNSYDGDDNALTADWLS
jgi:GH25 family lysozyme M1 (1,4-beta-N-acetylmuramidase)